MFGNARVFNVTNRRNSEVENVILIAKMRNGNDLHCRIPCSFTRLLVVKAGPRLGANPYRATKDDKDSKETFITRVIYDNF